MEKFVIHWTWSMASSDTFDIPAIGIWVKNYLKKSKLSIDPFARNKRWATFTNDLNEKTAAEYHLDALDFLKMLAAKEIRADLVIFDPPYSLEQLKRSYESVGRDYTLQDGWKPGRWSEEKKLIEQVTTPDAYMLSFGWNTVGMGKRWTKKELIVVCHGPGHNDTLCLAEQRLPVRQGDFMTTTHKSDVP